MWAFRRMRSPSIPGVPSITPSPSRSERGRICRADARRAIRHTGRFGRQPMAERQKAASAPPFRLTRVDEHGGQLRISESRTAAGTVCPLLYTQAGGCPCCGGAHEGIRQLCTQAGRMGLGAPGSGVEGRWGRGLDRPRALRGGSRRRRADGWLAGPGRTPAHLLERGPCRFRSLPARMAACLCQGPAVPVGRHPPRPARWRRVAGGAPRRSASAALHRSPRRLEARPVATPPSRLRGRVRHLRPGSAPGTRLPRLSRGSDP